MNASTGAGIAVGIGAGMFGGWQAGKLLDQAPGGDGGAWLDNAGLVAGAAVTAGGAVVLAETRLAGAASRWSHALGAGMAAGTCAGVLGRLGYDLLSFDG